MRLISLTRHLRLVAAIFMAATPAFAADSYNVANGATTAITEHAQCRQVTNNKGLGLFVPTKTAAEWASVYNATTPGVSIAACASARTWVGTGPNWGACTINNSTLCPGGGDNWYEYMPTSGSPCNLNASINCQYTDEFVCWNYNCPNS